MGPHLVVYWRLASPRGPSYGQLLWTIAPLPDMVMSRAVSTWISWRLQEMFQWYTRIKASKIRVYPLVNSIAIEHGLRTI